MSFRKFSASKIFDGFKFLEEDTVLVTDREGVVTEIIKKDEAGGDVEVPEGILMPGFINCHCHVELSYLKNIIPPYTGLVNFLITVVKSRRSIEVDFSKIESAAKEMYESGIDGVADICNTSNAIATKASGKIRWHNLIEIINFSNDNLQKQLEGCNLILEEHKSLNTTSALTPHAPYSISSATFNAINKATAGQIISIHNQETAAENELFISGGGEFLKLYKEFGNGQSPFAISGKTSLQTYLPHFTNGQTIMLVHNTFISEEDILFAAAHAKQHELKIIYCLCPNANLYIENTLPPVELLMKHNCKIVIGTDSYSSNTALNIGAEIKTLNKNFPSIPLEEILKWATGNGAEALRWNNELGSFEKGKKPGVILLKKDFSTERIL